MAQYDSPLGSKKITGSALREFDIPDDSGYSEAPTAEEIAEMRRRAGGPPISQEVLRDFQSKFEEDDPAEVERQIRAAREARRTGKERLNDGVKRRIAMLVGMTCGTREVDIDGNIFILQTLSSKDMREAIMRAAEFDGTVESPFEIRKQLLARSLTQVAGVEIAQFVGSNDLEARMSFIDEQHEALLNRLYGEYLSLTEEVKKKYSIKDAADAKELAEDLKK